MDPQTFRRRQVERSFRKFNDTVTRIGKGDIPQKNGRVSVESKPVEGVPVYKNVFADGLTRKGEDQSQINALLRRIQETVPASPPSAGPAAVEPVRRGTA